MANYSNLKAAIAAAIKQNGNQEITGQVLQDVLTSMVSVIGANYTFAGVATPSTNPGTPDQNLTYLAMEGGTYTNFNGTVLPAGISLLMWNGTWTSKTVMCGDGGVFDISVYKSSGGTLATFADLAAALDGGNNIPASARNGGMSVKFVQSSDNNYLQFRCMAQNFTTDVTQWQGADDEPVSGSENLVKSGGVKDGLLDIQHSIGDCILTDDYYEIWNNNDVNGRLRIIYKCKNGQTFEGISTSAYGTYVFTALELNDARNGTNVSELYTQSYTREKVTGTCHIDGYLVFSLRKPDGTLITEAEALELYNTLSVAIYSHYAKSIRKEIEDEKTEIDENAEGISDIKNGIENKLNLSIFTKEDADVYRVDANTGEVSPTGERLRIVIYTPYPSQITTQCTEGRGVVVSLYRTLQNAQRGDMSVAIENLQATYTTDVVEGSFTQGGYVTVSLCKTYYDSFSDADIATFVSNLMFHLITGPKVVLGKEQSFTEQEKAIIKYNLGIDSIDLPSYWKTYLNNKLTELNNADAGLGRNGVSFAFISDIHVDANAGNSPELLKWIKNNTNVKDVVCGGDLLYDDTNDISKNTKVNALKQLGWWKQKTSDLNTINIRGNHDSNEEYPSSTGQTVSLGEFYALECRQAENRVTFVDNTCYGFMDNDNQKVRYIFLDSLAPHTETIDDTQIAWMKARIQELQSGWTVVLFVHGLWTVSGTQQVAYNADGEKIVNALDSIYDELNCTIACVISGHCHVDFNQTSAKGIVLISTTTDAMGWNASYFDWNYPNRVAGTTTEQCFDLFYIDTENRTIKTVRIGAGDTTGNRTISY